MSQFMDDEAEVSEGEEEEEFRQSSKKQKSSKKPKRPTSDSSEEEDDEDEDKIKEEMKDLINDDEEEEEIEDDSDDDGDKKRKHDDDDSGSEELDEEDLALIKENIGVKIAPKKKKYKRVKRVRDEESDNDDNEPQDVKDQIANELFDGDDEPGRDAPRIKEDPEGDKYGAVSDSEESDDEDNFIVDDEDRPIARPKKKRGKHQYNNEAMQQAQDIFGVDFDFEEIEHFGQEDEYYDEDQEEDAYEDETEEGAADAATRRKGRRRAGRKSIFDIYEPSELEKGHLTENDRKIRDEDVPERFMTRPTPLRETTDEPEIEEEAEWIYSMAFNENTLTCQNPEGGLQPLAGQKDPGVIIKIREALRFMRSSLHEVPFITTYKKEYVRPDLETNDLWTIYKWDEKFCQLQDRKRNLLKLYQNMLAYQTEQLAGSEVIPGAQRIIGDSDLERVKNISSFEELHDCWLHFQMYYSHEIPAMKKGLIQKEKERRKEERMRKRQAKMDSGIKPEEDLEVDAGDSGDDEDEALDARFSSMKLAQRKDTYTVCREAGIGGLAAKYGLTAEQLGENIRDQYTKHEVVQYEREPLDAAADFVCTRFPTPESVLSAARFMVAKEIASNPLVRKCLRTAYKERCLVTCCPTQKGLKDGLLTDENHPCWSYKYAKGKPIHKFVGDQFLNLTNAEKDGLMSVELTVDKIEDVTFERTPYLNEIKPLYHKDAYSDYVSKWNDERTKVLEIAFEKMLYPQFQKEMKLKMRQEACSAIVMEAGRKLQRWLRAGPYVVPASITEDEEFDTRDGIRIMGFAFLPERDQAAFAAVIDGNGEVTDHLRLPNFMLRTKSEWAPESDRQLREKDVIRLKNFILAKKPHVIAVGAETLETRRVIMDLEEIIQQLGESDQYPPISIEVLPNDVAKVYMNSRKAKTEFPEYPDLLRQAVSLARRLQDPLIEFSQLCSADEEILCLKYHHQQENLSKDELLEAINIEFVNIVNEVGVDVNRAIAHPHTAPLVQFIAGFGPRKAAAFLKTLKKLNAQLLESRTQLIMNCKFGAKVFINCAGFIKIDTSQLSDSTTDTYIEVLDSTRVHPEAYEWARKMAVDALEYEDDTEVNPSGALDEILENPDKLRDLDLDAFAEELEKQGFGNKSTTLYDIRAELSHRFKDPRDEYRPPLPDEVFEWFTGETAHTLYNGKLVTCTVIKIARKPPSSEELDSANPLRDDDTHLWKCPFCSKKDFTELSDVWNHFDAQACPGNSKGVSVRLDSGIYGFIRPENLSVNPVDDLEERVQPGMTIHARVLRITVEKFSVDLTSRSDDLNCNGLTKNAEIYPRVDTEYYDFASEDIDKDKLEGKKKKETTRQPYIKRIIVHPSFKNIGYREAEIEMSEKSQGDCLFRPSSKGDDHLTLTWKVHFGINQHVDILEQGKDKPYSLGSQLIIGKEVFEDLDEIIARYVQPMAAYARDLIGFRCFRNAEGGKREVMDKYLKDEQKKQPSKIHYFVSASKEYPGKFLLSYLPREKVIHEYITITPEGFRYRMKVFRSVSHLFRWFKEHFRDPIPRPVGTPVDPALQKAAASIPNEMLASLSHIKGLQGTPVHGTPGSVRMGPPSTPSEVRMTPGGSWIPKNMPPPPSNRPSSPAGADWAQMMAGQDRKPYPYSNRTPQYATPGASSQMSISPTQSPAGMRTDQTPLEDEWS